MKILIIGDSLTFAHGVNIDDTWPFLLQKNGHKVTHRGRGGSTITKVLDELHEIKDWSNEKPNKYPLYFDIYIVQVGIVDAKPRPFGKGVTYLLKQLPFGNVIISRLSKSKLFLKYFGTQWTSEKKFFEKTKILLKETSKIAKKTYFLEIAKPAHYLKQNCGDFSKIIEKYNRILKTNCKKSSFLNVFNNKKSDKYLLRDGHHLNIHGHKIIYKTLLNKLKFK